MKKYDFVNCPIECGVGWGNLLTTLFNDIEKYLEANKIKDFKIVQIKEKFGGLRVYCYNSNDKIEKLIDVAESKAVKTCEVCGKQGKIIKVKGWLSCRCETCRG